MTVSTLCSRALYIYGYDVEIYKGYSIDNVDYKIWSGRDNDIPIGLIDKEVVDWALNWSYSAPETKAVLTIVVH